MVVGCPEGRKPQQDPDQVGLVGWLGVWSLLIGHGRSMGWRKTANREKALLRGRGGGGVSVIQPSHPPATAPCPHTLMLQPPHPHVTSLTPACYSPRTHMLHANATAPTPTCYSPHLASQVSSTSTMLQPSLPPPCYSPHPCLLLPCRCLGLPRVLRLLHAGGWGQHASPRHDGQAHHVPGRGKPGAAGPPRVWRGNPWGRAKQVCVRWGGGVTKCVGGGGGVKLVCGEGHAW